MIDGYILFILFELVMHILDAEGITDLTYFYILKNKIDIFVSIS